MKQFKTYEVVYKSFRGTMVTEYYTARNSEEAVDFFNGLSEVDLVVSVEVL